MAWTFDCFSLRLRVSPYHFSVHLIVLLCTHFCACFPFRYFFSIFFFALQKNRTKRHQIKCDVKVMNTHDHILQVKWMRSICLSLSLYSHVYVWSVDSSRMCCPYCFDIIFIFTIYSSNSYTSYPHFPFVAHARYHIYYIIVVVGVIYLWIYVHKSTWRNGSICTHPRLSSKFRNVQFAFHHLFSVWRANAIRRA